MSVEGPRRKDGSRVPLFARLFDYQPRQEEMQPRRVLGRAELLESIRAELARLLNTRAAATGERLSGQERTVVNYGLPDFLTLNPRSDRDREQLARLIVDAVRAYEPRLRNPIARVAVDGLSTRVLLATIEGTLALDPLAEPVAFPLTIRDGSVAVGCPASEAMTTTR